MCVLMCVKALRDKWVGCWRTKLLKMRILAVTLVKQSLCNSIIESQN